MSIHEYCLKRVDYLSSDLEFCRKHWDWAVMHGKKIFIIENARCKYSIAISTDSRTICSEDANAIVSYKEPFNQKIGLEIIQFLESENVLSIYPLSRDFHHRLIQKLCLTQTLDSSLCTCGAAKTFGLSSLKQRFIHSSWCDILK